MLRPHEAIREPEPTHLEILRRIDVLGADASARFDAIDREARYIRGRVDELAGDVAVLKAHPGAAGGGPPEHDGGLPFKYGWRSWTAVGALAVAILGGIASAFEKAGSFFLNLGHMFNSTPGS